MLDYLAARPEVDPQRLGCTGVSGGGTYTMFLGAFDGRLKATVPVCSTSSLERKHRQGQIGEPCQDVWRAHPDDLDTADLLLAHAPAALRIIGTRTAWINQRFAWSQDRLALLGADNMLAYVGYMLGSPSVAQRVQDVLGVLRYLRTRPDVDAQRVFLCGHGGGAVVALHAAAVDGAVSGVALDAGLAAYRSAIEAPRNLQPVADFLPGALLHYDLPDLAAALAPATVLVLDPQDAMSQPLLSVAAEAAYARAARTTSLLGGQLSIATACPPNERASRIATWITPSPGTSLESEGQAGE